MQTIIFEEANGDKREGNSSGVKGFGEVVVDMGKDHLSVTDTQKKERKGEREKVFWRIKGMSIQNVLAGREKVLYYLIFQEGGKVI